MSGAISVGSLVACMIVSTADRLGGMKYSGTATSLSEDIEQTFGVIVSADQVSRSAKLMEDAGVTVVSRDSDDDPWISVDFQHFNRIFRLRNQSNAKRSSVALFERLHTLRSYGEFGNDWLDHVIGGRKSQGFFDIRDSDTEVIDVPAADRIVDLKHNQAMVQRLDGEIEKIESDIRFGNESGEIFGDNRPAILAELGLLRSLLNGVASRASTLKALATRTLGWIAEKASGAAVGEAAKIALKSFLEWLF